jgi:NAD(P)-dependent dehydrogenase (short-subunit alcohol dehydrogenase family)
MGKVILITGAGRGLGYAVTQIHAQRGDTVYALEYAITDELRRLAVEHPNLHVSQCDVGSDGSVNAALAPVLKAENHLEVLYNIAGIFSMAGKVGLIGTDIEMAKEDYNVNALGALRTVRASWPLIQKGTLVLIVSSEAGSVGGARRSAEYAYCMSKAAVNMLGKLLSNELWPVGGRVMLLHPGWLKTQMGGEAARQSKLSLEPEESAVDVVGIADDIENIPRDQIYMTQLRDILPW